MTLFNVASGISILMLFQIHPVLLLHLLMGNQLLPGMSISTIETIITLELATTKINKDHITLKCADFNAEKGVINLLNFPIMISLFHMNGMLPEKPNTINKSSITNFILTILLTKDGLKTLLLQMVFLMVSTLLLIKLLLQLQFYLHQSFCNNT